LRIGRTCPTLDRAVKIGKPNTEHEIEVVPVEEPLPTPAPDLEPAEQPVPA
jgi:hypothetical protein